MNIVLLGSKPCFAEIVQWCSQNEINVLGVICDDANKEICQKHNFKIIDEAEIINNLQWYTQNTDYVVSYLYWRILKEPILSMPKNGCINFHPAPLPEYKGLGGCSFAILNEEKTWGATAHYINAGIDTGDIIMVDRFEFDYKKETAYSLKEQTLIRLKNVFVNLMKQLKTGQPLPVIPQNGSEGKYYSKKDMLDAMKIDALKDDVDKKIQAFWFPPYDGAYIEINNKKYTLTNEVVLSQINKNCF